MTTPATTPDDRSDAHLPAGVLWDLDGTILETEPYWIAEEKALVEEYGGEWTQEHAHALVGNALLDSADYIRANSPVTLEPLEIVNRLQSGVIARLRERIPFRPGARELLEALREAGVPCALVTMSWTALVDVVVEALPEGTFAACITGDSVTHGKPHPEPYLAGARALGLEPGQCVAIEDSVTGSQAAVAAGTRALVVPNEVEVPEQPGLSRVATLAGVTPADLLPLTSR